MTKEEATIQALQRHIETLNETIEKQSKDIKALEQEPCEDCVSRAELLKYNTVYIDDSGVNRFCVPTQIVKTLPTVTPTRKKGKWTFDDGYPDSLICNKCRAKFDMWHWEQKQMHYCPNCGAEMESEE